MLYIKMVLSNFATVKHQQVERDANSLVSKSLFDIAKVYGFEVFEVNREGLENLVGSGDIFGLVSSNGSGSGRKIIVNKNLTLNQKRLVLAYSIGLIYSNYKAFMSDKGNGMIVMEDHLNAFKANQNVVALEFAMNLLMNTEAISQARKQYNGNLNQIAQQFGVSTNLLTARLLNLWLI